LFIQYVFCKYFEIIRAMCVWVGGKEREGGSPYYTTGFLSSETL